MKKAEFERILKYADEEHITIYLDDWFNCAGWFWINLTPKQLKRMQDLLEAQHTPVVSVSGHEWYLLKNGVRIIRDGFEVVPDISKLC